MENGSGHTAAETLITPEMNRHNGRIFLLANLLIYFSAPAVYVGVVQATLCHELGASATVANLPAATFLLGQIAPLFFSWLIPHRQEKSTVVWAARTWAALVVTVLLTLITPQPAWVRITAVSAQGLLQGTVSSLVQIFSIQCLGRGTTEAGRARTLKWTFSLGPIGAVAGSMAAQYILHSGFPWARFPLDFALIYLMAAPCIAGMAVLHTRWRLAPLPDEPRPSFLNFFSSSFRGYFQSSALLLLFLAYLLFMCAQSAAPTFVLQTQNAMGRDPQSVTGLTLVMRFACKAVGGYFLGMLALRFGLRASVMACLGLSAAAVLWAGVATNYWYLFALGLMGAGELGGAYFPVYALALAPLNLGPRNLSILTLAVPAASFAPVLIGALQDKWGFVASLTFALGAAVIALALLGVTRAPQLNKNL